MQQKLDAPLQTKLELTIEPPEVLKLEVDELATNIITELLDELFPDGKFNKHLFASLTEPESLQRYVGYKYLEYLDKTKKKTNEQDATEFEQLYERVYVIFKGIMSLFFFGYSIEKSKEFVMSLVLEQPFHFEPLLKLSFDILSGNIVRAEEARSAIANLPKEPVLTLMERISMLGEVPKVPNVGHLLLLGRLEKEVPKKPASTKSLLRSATELGDVRPIDFLGAAHLIRQELGDSLLFEINKIRENKSTKPRNTLLESIWKVVKGVEADDEAFEKIISSPYDIRKGQLGPKSTEERRAIVSQFVADNAGKDVPNFDWNKTYSEIVTEKIMSIFSVLLESNSDLQSSFLENFPKLEGEEDWKWRQRLIDFNIKGFLEAIVKKKNGTQDIAFFDFIGQDGMNGSLRIVAFLVYLLKQMLPNYFFESNTSSRVLLEMPEVEIREIALNIDSGIATLESTKERLKELIFWLCTKQPTPELLLDGKILFNFNKSVVHKEDFDRYVLTEIENFVQVWASRIYKTANAEKILSKILEMLESFFRDKIILDRDDLFAVEVLVSRVKDGEGRRSRSNLFGRARRLARVAAAAVLASFLPQQSTPVGLPGIEVCKTTVVDTDFNKKLMDIKPDDEFFNRLRDMRAPDIKKLDDRVFTRVFSGSTRAIGNRLGDLFGVNARAREIKGLTKEDITQGSFRQFYLKLPEDRKEIVRRKLRLDDSDFN